MVKEYNSSGGEIAVTYDDSPATVESAINLLNATARVNIYMEYASPSDTAVPVGFIDFNTSGSPQSQINFVVGEGGFAADDTEMSLGNAMRCSTWRGFTAPVGVDTRLYGRLNGDLIGSGGTFTNETFLNVDKLSFLVIDGQLNARINFQAPASTFFAVHAGSMGQHGRIELQSSDIDRIIVAGDVATPAASDVASIVAHAGNIDEIELTGGSLRGDVIARGYSSDSAGGRIGQINVAGHIGRTFTATQFGDPDSAATFPTLSGSTLNGPVLCIEASNGIDRRLRAHEARHVD